MSIVYYVTRALTRAFRRGRTSSAMRTLSEEMKKDPDLAWAWHCNLAMMAVDAGAKHEEANKRAADLMRRAFGVSTDEYPHYKNIMSQYHVAGVSPLV